MDTNDKRATDGAITRAFSWLNLSPFGDKLLKVGLSVLTLVVTGYLLRYCSWTIWVWVPASVWLSWRYFLRYLTKGSFICSHCGRLKCEKHFGSLSSVGSVCTTCNDKRADTLRTLENIEKSVVSIREGIALRTNGDYPKADTPIIIDTEHRMD